MNVPHLHAWDLEASEARALQEKLAPRVRLQPLPPDPELLAGADVAFSKKQGLVFASVVVLRLPEMEIVEEVGAHVPYGFPYVPGLLSFREGPAVLAAFRRLDSRPDIVIFDGHGYAHPRRFGLASHMGLWLGLPAVGCAKSRLVGEHDEPGDTKGESVPLLDDGEQIGVVLRSRTDVKPIYVSPGHLSDFDSAEQFVLRCCVRYRLPEPTRQADHAVSRLKREYLESHPTA